MYQSSKCDVLVIFNYIFNLNSPAAIETPIFEKTGIPLDFMRQRVADSYPLGRIGQVSDTTAAILFAASDAASFISGSTIDVDGGSLAGAPLKK